MDSIISANRYADKLLKKIGEGSSSVFYKIDWFTLILKNVTMRDVFRFFHIYVDDSFGEVFKLHVYSSDTNYGRQIRLRMDGVLFEVEYYDMISKLIRQGIDVDDVKNMDPSWYLDVSVGRVRCDCSGQGCDELRRKYVNVETLLRDKLPTLGFDFHFTRIDFAYDFINYQGSFVADLRRLCQYYESANERINCGQGEFRPSGMAWKMKYSSTEDTMYFGSRASGLLRVYDKNKEREANRRKRPVATIVPDANEDEVKEVKCEYTADGDLPESWVRIELQTVPTKYADLCFALLYAENYSAESVLRYIFDKYAIHAGNGNCGICKEWKEFYDWDELPHIIQNAKRVETLDLMSSAERAYDRNLKNEIIIIGKYGKDEYVERVLRNWFNLQNSDDERDRRRFNCILTALFTACRGKPDYLEYNKANGLWYVVDSPGEVK